MKANSGKPATMLVVDDEALNRKIVEGYLRADGYVVESAPDGPTALAMAQKNVPDVVLLDVMMPGLTGYQVCEALKADPLTRLSQVMLVTALDSTPDKVEGLDTGADDYVTKPVRREEFLAKVRALLRARGLLLELEAARVALAERNEELQLKRMLAQTLVHDLKNPLAAVLGNLDLLSMRCAEDLNYLIQRSRLGGTRMQKMILNLLDVEGLEDGKLVPQIEPVDATAVARAAVEESEPLAAQGEVTLQLEALPEAWIQADAALFRRVMDNLLSNAVAYTPAGGTVRVVVSAREEGVEISVSDSGPGIPEEYRERVFEKYAQVGAQEAGVSANRGLGLTFCRMVVEAHRGTIWVDSAPRGGAWIRTIFPDAVPAKPLDREQLAAVES